MGEEVERSVILFLTDNRQGEAGVTHEDISMGKNISMVRELRQYFCFFLSENKYCVSFSIRKWERV